jgi:hypothetical protein
MDHQMGGAALPGEAEMVRVELMAVEAETKFHDV